MSYVEIKVLFKDQKNSFTSLHSGFKKIPHPIIFICLSISVDLMSSFKLSCFLVILLLLNLHYDESVH